MTDTNNQAPKPKFFQLPDRSVLTGGLAGLIAWALLAAFSAIFHFDLGAYLQPYVTALWSVAFANAPAPSAQGAIAIIIGFAITYLVPDSDKNLVKKVDDRIIALARSDPDSPATPITK